MRTSEVLGYSDSRRFYSAQRVDDLPANELAFALRLATKECLKLGDGPTDVRFEGAYVLQRDDKSPAVPVVYVVQVANESVAKRVHQFVWNQNQAPFLIVESPGTVRLYPGFAFVRDDDTPLESAATDVADVLDKLAGFRAESIDDGTLWREWGKAVDPSKRVDETLLCDLNDLDQKLQTVGVDRAVSHGLIGKFVYLRYLKDRDILSSKKLAKWGIDSDHLFTQQATLKAFRHVNEELQTWLNGSVFSLGDAVLNSITQAQLRLVAGIFRGEPSDGQLRLFDAYDFAHIPIETLSCVYEQFLHDAKGEDGTSRGKTLGAYYTPLPLADYVLSELDHRRPLKPGMKVLDPACGSGAFLVQCYRRLIERQRRVLHRELKKTELRDLLSDHVYGIDRDDDACRVAELSLIMTLLDYVQPPDLEDTSFKLPCLRDRNIFQGDFFDDAGPVHDLLAKQRFDWIVGNPPWAEVKGIPDVDHEHYVADQWMKAHKSTHPTSGNQIAEAFIWKAGDHLNTKGVCGLVVLAMTWFKKEATTFRKRFFSEHRVWCLANFANLAYVLFAGRSERPASVVFFESDTPDDDHIILTFAPFVAEQVANRPEKPSKKLRTWNIVVSGNDIREIENLAAKSGDSLTWKLAMWGTSRDRKLLQRLDVRFKDDNVASLQRFGITSLHQGLELRPLSASAKEQIEHHPELIGKKKLRFERLRNIGRVFALPAMALDVIGADECYVRKGRATLPIKVSSPPHIIVDASRRFAVFSNEFIAVPARQIGIAGNTASSNALRALSLYLSSDFIRYHQFFNSPKWGVDESIADLHTLKLAPFPIVQLSSAELNDWANLQIQLSEVSKRIHDPVDRDATDSDDKELQRLVDQVNDRVYRLLGMRPLERWFVEDFVQHHLGLNKGKASGETIRLPTPDERHAYLVALRDCLDGFLSIERGLRHRIEMLAARDSVLLSVSLSRSKVSIDPITHVADGTASRNLKTIRDRLRSKHSQWVYFDRSLKVYERGVLYQFKPLQRLHWTRRQAVLDADDIIAETLAEGGVI